jgi:hypothetical protein
MGGLLGRNKRLEQKLHKLLWGSIKRFCDYFVSERYSKKQTFKCFVLHNSKPVRGKIDTLTGI